ncbi:hypothetical protein HB904_09365 [Listeria booriae]|uniref:Uncharacterized protein n=1 Tax=Listeria booriae TaxID=1552123 RepID=A0A842AG99_9LIST|nr:hypothetical protein [Listeria booriae]MBC1616397.1 hypothetical protein [Listeria booriae]
MPKLKVGDMVEIQDRAGAEQYTTEGQHCLVIETGTVFMNGDGQFLQTLRLQDPCGDEFFILSRQVKLIKNGGMNK